MTLKWARAVLTSACAVSCDAWADEPFRELGGRHWIVLGRALKWAHAVQAVWSAACAVVHCKVQIVISCRLGIREAHHVVRRRIEYVLASRYTLKVWSAESWVSDRDEGWPNDLYHDVTLIQREMNR